MAGEFSPETHRRRSIRLRGYDYSSSGFYFVTVCTKNKECLFGEIADGAMALSEAGKMIETVWAALPEHYGDLDLDIIVVMPNHLHGIIVLTDTSLVGARLALPGSKGAASSAPTLGYSAPGGWPRRIRNRLKTTNSRTSCAGAVREPPEIRALLEAPLPRKCRRP
jgi:hypothetical protein